MSTKDYVAIAKIINDSEENSNMPRVWYIATKLSDYFETENPKFNKHKFIRACGIITPII